MHLKTKSWQHMTALPSSSTCSVCSWWTSCCAFAMRFSVWWCCVAFPGIRFQAEIGRVLRFSHSHIAHSPDTFQRERQRGRGWEVLICFDNFGKIIAYSNISNSCCIMLYHVVSCCTPFGAFCSEDPDLLQHRLHAHQLIFWRWCCLLILFWSDVGQMLVIVGNWTTKSRHQKINTNLVFNTLAKSQSFWIRNGKKVGNSSGTQQIEF